jgi:hypothetical protein
VKQKYEIFADYHQFYIQDDDEKYGDLSLAWTPEAVDRLLAMGPHVVGIGTARNMPVPVTIEISEAEPEVSGQEFDRTNDYNIEVRSGRLVLAGCTDYFPDAVRVHCSPGMYNVRIGYKNLDTISDDGLDGDDSYHLFLWPAA